MEILALIFVILVILFLATALKKVPQSEQWVVERFGKYTHTLSPGLHFILPFVDSIGGRISMRETVLDVPSQDVITKDNAMVHADGILFFQVVDPALAAYEVSNLEAALNNLAMTNIRTVMGSMDLDQLLSNREHINVNLLKIIDQATGSWGVKVTRIEIKDIHPPKDLIESMGRQMKAERDKRAEILIAEGERQSQILRAEGEKQAAVLKAEGEKEASFRQAEARERLAEAEAEATKMVSLAISAGNVQAINYFVAQKYIEALGALASADNQKVILMPLEATNVLGALGGVAQIAKEAFDSKKD
jgi:regulator of protease activity HflC (stomatin/prohibitin superfamily)